MDQNEALEALRQAFQIEPAPRREDGWVPVQELIEKLGVSDFYLRRRARRQPDKLEAKIHKKILYYRVIR